MKRISTMIRIAFCIAAVLLGAGAGQVAYAMAQSDPVTIVLLPAESNVTVGQSFAVTTQVQAGTNELIAAAAYIDFDPAVLEVESIQVSPAFSLILANQYFNTGPNAGQINFAAGVLTTTLPSGTFTLIEVQFRALATTDGSGTRLTFANAGLRKTDAFAGIDSVLTGTSPASIIVAPECYALVLGHTGQGSDPVATPANSDGCVAGQYVAGASISLSGAVPASDWQIDGWTGTDDDGSTALTNTVTMPASAHSAGVTYREIPLVCYVLTLGHTGQGSDPVATPANSDGCVAGQYVAGASINLSGAAPVSGWQIGGWTGTDDDSSTAATNTVTLPAADQTVRVVYVEDTEPIANKLFIYLPGLSD